MNVLHQLCNLRFGNSRVGDPDQISEDDYSGTVLIQQDFAYVLRYQAILQFYTHEISRIEWQSRKIAVVF